MIREHPRFEKTAIIFVSAIHLTEFDRIRGYETGAVDYVPVPVVPESLRAKVRIFVELYRKTRELIALNRELERRVGERTAELEASNDRLRESEERLRLAGEAAGFGTYDYNVDADRVHCSTGLKRLLGTELEGDFSLDVLVSLVHDVDREAFRECLLAARAQNQERHEIEFRVALPDGSVRWLLDRGRTYVSDHFAGTRSHVRVMGTMIDITGRKRSDERQALLMGELDHRVKNILANMSAIAKLSSAKATSVASFVRDLDGRIQAISGAHTLLRAHAWNGADLVDLVNETMAPFRSSGNISVEGGHIMLEPRVAQTFALMLHELATNAVKYGALSSPKGRINIKWSGSSDVRKLKFVWQETGGPTVHQPNSTGFGSRVLKSAAKDVGAMAACSFKAEGFESTLTAGPTPIATDARIEEETMPAAFPAQSGLRILVVEDEPLVALQIQGDLESDGHFVIGPAGTAEQGLELAAGETFDYAILDVRLGQTTSESIANKLIERTFCSCSRPVTPIAASFRCICGSLSGSPNLLFCKISATRWPLRQKHVAALFR